MINQRNDQIFILKNKKKVRKLQTNYGQKVENIIFVVLKKIPIINEYSVIKQFEQNGLVL